MLSACTSGQDQPQPASSSTTTTSTITTAPKDAPEDRHGATVTPTPSTSPSWDKGSTRSATDTATRAMRLFVRQDVSAAKWWTDLEPLLTPQAAQAYEGTDPTWGAPIKVTGKADLVEGGSAYLARVHFLTNQGTYLVLLSRSAARDPWLVERFTPPEDLGH